ncbi:hypothetical protein [Methylobacterium sp. CM6257]
MSSKEEMHAFVAFAKRHGNPTMDFFNAYSSIYRLESLIEDANKIKGMFEKFEPEEERWFPWIGTELCSYYAVGCVTCLEWHVRSRLVDLFTYKPSALKSTDIQGKVNDKIVPQMIAQNATVAQLIGAATNIGSFQTYMAHFVRIFSEIGIAGDPYKSVVRDALGEAALVESQFEELEDLFRFRNTLVHEIGVEVLGHANIREGWDPGTSIEKLSLTLRLIRGIERAILDFGPSDFPNRVTETGIPIPQLDMLMGKLDNLETKLRKTLANTSIMTWDGQHDAYEKAQDLFHQSVAEEEHFITYTPLLHSKYMDQKTPLKVKLYKDRVDYLEMMLDMIRSMYDIDSEADDEAKGGPAESEIR